jgi:hypothetical protein
MSRYLIGAGAQPEEVSGIVSAASGVLLGGTLLAGALWRRLD